MRSFRFSRLLLVCAATGMLINTAALCVPPEPPNLTGPLSDFWPKVHEDWSNRLESLNHGSLQTFIWVPIIWDGPDEHDLARLIDRLRVRERHNWLRSGATEHRWRDIAGRNLARLPFMRQNCILIGTPGENKLVEQALAVTPLRVDAGSVKIGDRVIEGENLLLIAIVPNPAHPSSYSLVFTGSSTKAILRADQVPYGDTDYIVFRGDRIIERGYFNWRSGVPARDHLLESQSFTTHLTWKVVDSRFGRLHHDPATISADRVTSVGRKLEAEIRQTASFFGIPENGLPQLDIFLYGSIDEKVAQTGDPRTAHVDPADDSLHAVLAPGDEPPEPSLVASIILGRGSNIWTRTESSDLPGLHQALSLACRDSFQGIPLSEWATHTSRDAGWLPVDRLFYRIPHDLESGDLDLLDAAAFLRDLITREGAAKVASYYTTTRRSNLSARFASVFGIQLGSAERRWLETTQTAAKTTGREKKDAKTDKPAQPQPGWVAAREAFLRRDNDTAEKLLMELTPTAATRTLLARISFRTGRFDRATVLAGEVLSDPQATADDRAWARLTLGRALAATSRRIAAIAQFRHEDISADSGQPRILADYWLETMSLPLNQRAAHRVIVREAQVELTNWDWEAAEKKLQVVLAADPLNRQAHELLGRVYLSKYTYWFDYALLDRELFPGESVADPEMYRELMHKGHAELDRASRLPTSSEDPLDGGTASAELSGLDADEPGMTHLMLGKAHVLEGNLAAAVVEFDAALATTGVGADLAACCHLYLGRIAALRGDRASALKQFNMIVALRANDNVTSLARQELMKLGSATGAR